MPIIELETHIYAEINICFDLARSIDFHILSTGDTNEKAIAGCTTGLIGLNEFVTWEAKHLGFTQHLTSRITQFETNKHFRDEQIKGPFKKIVRDHIFIQMKDEVLTKDRFEFEAPFGLIGKLFCRIYLTTYMHRLLSERNNLLKEYAESEKWKSIFENSENNKLESPFMTKNRNQFISFFAKLTIFNLLIYPAFSGLSQFNFSTIWQHELLTQSADDSRFYTRDLKFDHAGNVITIGLFNGTGTLDGIEVIECYEGIFPAKPFILKQDASGNVMWSRPIIESGVCSLSSFDVDADNNLYLAGSFSGIVDFDPGIGEEIHGENILPQWFILKLSPDGNFLGFYSGMTNSDGYGIRDIVTDGSFIYAAGSYSHYVDLDPGSGEYLVSCSDAFSSENAFLLKLNLDCELIWAKADTIGHVSSVSDIALGTDHEIVLSGYYVHDFDPDFSTGTIILPTDGSHTNFYSATYSSNGDFDHVVYGENIGDSEYVRDSAIDLEGNLILLGQLDEPVDLDPTESFFNIGNGQGDQDMFVIKYSPVGELIWAHSLGTAGFDDGYSMRVDASGYIYVAGISGTGNFIMDNEGNTLATSENFRNGLLFELNQDGSFVDIILFGQTEFNSIYDMAWNTSDRMVISIVHDSPLTSDITGFEPIENPIGNTNTLLVCFDSGNLVKEIDVAKISFYPNPCNGQFTISSDQFSNKMNVRISNLQGQVVFEKNYSGYHAEVQAQIAQGIYHMEVKTEGGVCIQKMLVLP